MLADDPGAVNHHGVPILGKMVQDRLQGRGQGVGEDRGLISKSVRQAEQAAGMSRQEPGHAPSGLFVETQDGPRREPPLGEVFAQIILSLGAEVAGLDTPDFTGQERLHRHPFPGAPF